jgi:lipopolysaccharide/colanic/teichoic acid biosynthesis glycosyltransferase
MSIEIYPRTAVKPGIYKRVTQKETNKTETEILNSLPSFFYIGRDEERIKRISALFDSGFIAEHFSSAQDALQNLNTKEDTTPDVIIIDVPYSESTLHEFVSFLRKSETLTLVPLLYNKNQVINGYKEQLKKIKLIDDIIDIDSFQYNLSDKINFLRETKVYAHQYGSSNATTVVKKAPACEPGNEFNIKRILDIILASLIMVILFPVFLLIALAIKIESRGSVFYNSYRAGTGFKIFRFYKFRTMHVGADKKLQDLAHLNQYNNSLFFKVNNDPRVTHVGTFLRRTSLDELPQLLNVLKGDMSLVGNRPLPLYEAATLTTNESVERFMAPAGMTGLWQIKKRGKSNMSVEERISLDIAYARKHNLAYDLWIMANTPGALFQKSNT